MIIRTTKAWIICKDELFECEALPVLQMARLGSVIYSQFWWDEDSLRRTKLLQLHSRFFFFFIFLYVGQHDGEN